MAVGIYAGVPIGLVAALISRTWRGVLTLSLGFLVYGAIYGAVASSGGLLLWALFVFLERGVLAVPTYLVITALTSSSSRSAGTGE